MEAGQSVFAPLFFPPHCLRQPLPQGRGDTVAAGIPLTAGMGSTKIPIMTNYDFNYHGPVVVFDLDDTLMRERDFCRSGFRHIEKRLIAERGEHWCGIAASMEERLNNRANYFALLEERLAAECPDAQTLRSLMADIVADYRSHRPDRLHMAPGAAALISELQRRGIVMALVTDGRSVTQRRKIEALGLNAYINPADIFISEERGADKLQPDSFCEIVRRYPEARRFIYVADNPDKDFRMPNLLGWTTCRVPIDADNVHPDPAEVAETDRPAVSLGSIEEVLTLCEE